MAGGADDFGKFLEALGLTSETIVALGGSSPEIGVPLGIALFVAGVMTDWTTDDLNTLRYAIAKSSNTQPIRISMGSDIVQWGVAVNGERVVSHWDVHPLLTPKGVWKNNPMEVQ